MQKKSNIYTILANTAVFIFLEIAALNMLSSSSSVQNFFITRNLQGLAGRFWGISESVSRYFSLPKENKALADDIFELNKKISKMTRALEIAKLDSLARIDMELASDKFKFMPATVVKNSLNKQHNYLIIGKGSDDGVRPQSGIINDAYYSYAISFLNSELSISARIGNDGAAGPMVWDGKHIDGALLREIPLQYKFDEGDTVYTSGYSSIFPPDIPLGVTGDTRIVNGATYEVKIKLFQDFSALRYVTIVTNSDIQEIEDLENYKRKK